MAALDRAQILGMTDMRVQRVSVPEWGHNGVAAEVFVRRFSVADWKALTNALNAKKDSAEFNLQVVLLACSDEHGVRLFTEADAPALMDRDFLVIKRIATAATEFNQPPAEEL